MDKEKLKAYGVDYENAVKRFAGNEALYFHAGWIQSEKTDLCP